MRFRNDAARFAYEQKCRQNAKSQKKKIRETMPAVLDKQYRVVREDSGAIVKVSNNIHEMARVIGVGSGEVARVIKFGGTIKCDFHYRIEPVK